MHDLDVASQSPETITFAKMGAAGERGAVVVAVLASAETL
jgi:hypothetical protein